jgi:hypothetical protein
MVARLRRLDLAWLPDPCALGMETFRLGASFVFSKKHKQ